MVHLGIDIGTVKSRNSLRDALQLAFRMLSERSAAAPLVGNGSASANGHTKSPAGPAS